MEKERLMESSKKEKVIELYLFRSFTCISGSIPFPKMEANIDIEVKALKTLVVILDSKE